MRRSSTSSSSDRRGVGGLPGAILLAVLLAGVVLSASDPALLAAPGRARLSDGSFASAWQKAYDEGLPLRDAGSAVWALIRWSLFREGRPGVLAGADGWLFSGEEFAPPADLSVALDDLLAFAVETRDFLRERDIGLVVALVPTKARVHADRLGRYRVPSGLAHRYETTLWGIRSLGIEAPDLLEPLLAAAATGEAYLRTDTHWSARGARVAADALAGSILPLLADAGSPVVPFVTASEGTEELSGDLLGFVPLGPWSRLGPTPDRIEVTVTTQATSDGAAVGLFGELNIPVALVGTSYSAGGEWNFDGALRTALSADVLNVAEPGKGPIAPMRGYLASPAIGDPRPHVVVWEIPERYVIP